MAYLDSTGLAYFWGKIKAYVAALLAPKADDSNVVHKTGDERIQGSKVFDHSYVTVEQASGSVSLRMRNASAVRSAVPASAEEASLIFVDKNYDWLGVVDFWRYMDGEIAVMLDAYGTSGHRSRLAVGIDANGVDYARCPSTSSSRSSGTDIVTRDWLPLDSRLVHASGDETIAGRKTFRQTGDVGQGFASSYTVFRNASFDRTSPAADTAYYNDLIFGDADNAVSAYNSSGRMGLVGCTVDTVTGYSFCEIVSRYYKSGTNFENYLSRLVVGFQPDGTMYASAPSTPDINARNNDTDILTRDWIPKDTRIVHTTGDEVISGTKQFNSYVRIGTAIQYRNSTLTKGTYPSNNVYYTLSFCDKNGYDVSNRFGILENTVLSNGDVNIGLAAYNNVASVTTTAGMGVCYKADGTKYAYAPSTPTTRNNGDDILTRDWIPKDTRIVHITGNETIDGVKNFKTSVNVISTYNAVYRTVDTYAADQLPGLVNWIGGFIWRDKNSLTFGGIEPNITATKLTFVWQAVGLTSSGSANTGVCVELDHGGGNETFRPQYENQMLLGTGGRRWKQLYAVTATINTSDERLKDGIGAIPEDVLDAWEGVDWIQFQFRDAVAEKGAGARLHTGLIAQRIAEAFSGRGLDESRYALFCHDRWDAVPESRSPDGAVMPASPAGDVYSVRYEEALCMEAAYMRRENARLKKRVADLEERLAALELRLGSA